MPIDLLDAQRLARLAERVYQVTGPVQTADLFPGALRSRTYDTKRHRLRFVHVEEADRHIVAFRGSLTSGGTLAVARSWGLNLRFRLKRIPFGLNARIHSGYHEQAGLACSMLSGALAGAKRVSITGHSQGGALALSLAIYFARRRLGRALDVTTFGQPMAGNGALCRYLDAHGFWPTERVIADGDGFVLSPPRRLGFRHCQSPFHLPGGGSAPGAPFGFSPRQTRNRHPIATYVSEISALVP
ncbi:MAG: lipase family protein [Pseudomonadota bacterium]